MILLGAVVLFLAVFLLLWWAFGNDTWELEDDDHYMITSLFGFKRDRGR